MSWLHPQNLISRAFSIGRSGRSKSWTPAALPLIVAGFFSIPALGWSDEPVASDKVDYSGALSLGVTVADSPGTGVLVVEVAEASPAAIAGIRIHDFILSVDEQDVERPANLQKSLRSRRGGEQVTLGLWRAGKTLSVTADLAAPAGRGAESRAWLGVALRGQRGESDAPGQAVIMHVLPGSPAENAKLQAGDTVLAINDQPIKSAAQLITMMGTMKPGETIHLTVSRDGKEVAHKIKLDAGAGARPIFAPPGFGSAPSLPMLDDQRMPIVPFGHVMRGDGIESMQQQMNQISNQLREMRRQLKIRVDSAIDDDDDREEADSRETEKSPAKKSGAKKSSDRQTRVGRKPRLESLPEIADDAVLAAPDDDYPRDRDDRYGRTADNPSQRVPAERYRRAPTNHRYYYYRWPNAGASVYPGFYVPWYTFPSNSPYISNWPPRSPYYYQYRGRNFYVHPTYGYGPGSSMPVFPYGGAYYH